MLLIRMLFQIAFSVSVEVLFLMSKPFSLADILGSSISFS